MLWKQGKTGSHLKFGLAPLFISGSLTGDGGSRDKCWDKNLLPKSSSVPVKPANITEPMKIEEAKPKSLRGERNWQGVANQNP